MTCSPARALDARSSVTVLLLCVAASVFDGYDLIVFGSVVPALLAHPDWHLTPAAVGVLAGYALAGTVVGALLGGPLTDRFGRRRMFLVMIVWFSVMTLLVAAAPNPGLLGFLRFLSGLGFGAIAPICVSLVTEVAPPGRQKLWTAAAISGLPLGGVLAALLAIIALGSIGFRGMFALGGIALVTIVPVAVRRMPESPAHRATAEREPRGAALRALRDQEPLVALGLLAAAAAAGYLVSYGLNTWLPQFMRQAGYDLGPALAFLLVFNAGSIVGSLTGGALADRWSARRVSIVGFALGAVATALLAVPLPAAAALSLVAAAGAASIGTITIVLAWTASRFPAGGRATAVGLCSGVGRLGSVGGPALGGVLTSGGAGPGWSFGAFALVAAAGGLLCAAVPAERSAAPGASRTGSLHDGPVNDLERRADRG